MFSTHNNKTFVFLVILYLWFGLGLTGCDVIYRFLDKEGAEEKELVGEVVPFEENENVEEIQELLALYGYNPGSIDGILGGKTRKAIVGFQEENGLKVTRFVDNETWRKLNVPKEKNLVTADNQINVPLMQTILDQQGFNPGKIDGKIGRKTIKAIKAFQAAHNLKVDGIVGYQTLSQLAEFL